MQKRTSKKSPTRRPTDVNLVAHILLQQSTQVKEPKLVVPARPAVSKSISRIMAQMGSKGGKIGGKRRLETQTPEQRSKIASDAAKARWAKAKKAEG
jgi:hypothetical protein